MAITTQKITNKTNSANITAREQLITVPGFGLIDLEFLDTYPNYVYINNYSGNTFYFGKSVLPSATQYDMVIDGYGDNLYANPNSFQKAYLYNSGGTDANLKVTSFVAPFEPSSLKGGGTTTVNAPASNVNSTVTAFSTSLPTGNNVLGHVIVDQMPTITVNNSLATGANHIGSVTLDGGLPALPTGSSHIGSVGIDGGVTIASMPPVTVSSSPVATQHQFFEASIAQTTVNFVMSAPINNINFIKNDGTTDLWITFETLDPSIAGNRATGVNMGIHLLGGEAVADLGRQCQQVNFYRTTGTGNVRFLGE